MKPNATRKVIKSGKEVMLEPSAKLDGGTGGGTTAPGLSSSEPEVQAQPWINPDPLPAELDSGTSCENHRAGPK